MTLADDYLGISQSVSDIRQYSLLTDSILRTIQCSTAPVRRAASHTPAVMLPDVAHSCTAPLPNDIPAAAAAFLPLPCRRRVLACLSPFQELAEARDIVRMIGRRDVYKCVGEFIVPQSQCPHFPTKVPLPSCRRHA